MTLRESQKWCANTHSSHTPLKLAVFTPPLSELHIVPQLNSPSIDNGPFWAGPSWTLPKKGIWKASDGVQNVITSHTSFTPSRSCRKAPVQLGTCSSPSQPALWEANPLHEPFLHGLFLQSLNSCHNSKVPLTAHGFYCYSQCKWDN